MFEVLKETQSRHTKVSEICYDTFRTQEYMNNHQLSNHEVALLFSLKSRSLWSVKNNFGIKINCSLGCPDIENQEHWLLCIKTKVNKDTHIVYSDIYGGIQQQIDVFQLYSRLEEEREELTTPKFDNIQTEASQPDSSCS